MSTRLVPCPSCHRHVRADELSCPFCIDALSARGDADRFPVPAPPGLSRAGIFRHAARGATALAGAMIGTSLLAAGCGDNLASPSYGIACDPYDGGCYGMPGDEFVLADAQLGDAGSDGALPGDGSPSDGTSEAAADALQSETGGETGTADAPSETSSEASPKETGATDAPHG